MKKLLARLWKEESGQGMSEYALILALVAVAAIAALIFLGGRLTGIFNRVGNNLNTQ
ncbi:Flp family type IVb pilin [Desulfofundulus thermosubterraneus]|uniref:Pilus assembly protein Flp/PilA n=1 Tax=Desulfofundulus thermosubterraneus DSM 16057 TaxID=1121432 RepID=A0A1M6D7L6_9FIRM|nr:Flp family type IVb pilin [Desulfofundulus thermosubterraneus]SHI69189.1 pilus assembly protein Flp/PilA [Desulfofundulus thermosubterraneus DSM 16057]